MKMKFASKLGVAAALLGCISSVAFAAPKMSAKTSSTKMSSKMKAAPKMTQMTGTITSVKGMKLTVKPVMKSNGTSKTVTVPNSASIMMGGKKVGLSSLKPGEKVTIFMSGTKITRINASAGSNKTKKKSTSKTTKM